MARKVKYYGMDIAQKKKKSNIKSDKEYSNKHIEYIMDDDYWNDYCIPYMQKWGVAPLPTFEERKRRLNGFLLLPIICKLFARKDSPYYNMVHEQEKKDWTRVLGN